MATALVALGSNLGDRQRNLDDAVAQLGRQPNVVVLATSRWRETKPIGGSAEQSEFLNGAVLLGTSLTPQQLHAVLQQLETAAGRSRESRWAPRTLDLDLLLYDDLVIDTPELTLPHPRMSFRRFVLEPTAEIAPNMRHPTVDWTIAALRDHLPNSKVGYMAAIAGPISAGKTTLAKAVVKSFAGTLIADVDHSNKRFESLAPSIGLKTRMVLRQATRFMAISDFWFAQAACSAALRAHGEQLAGFAEFFAHANGQVAKPKLLVMLDVPADVSWQRIAERGERNPPRLDWLARYRELLLKRVAEPGHGPVSAPRWHEARRSKGRAHRGNSGDAVKHRVEAVFGVLSN